MKISRFICLAMAIGLLGLGFTGCSTDDDTTTYTISVSDFTTHYNFDITEKLQIFEYNSDEEKVGQHVWADVIYGKDMTYEASSTARKVKIYQIITFSSSTDTSTYGGWVQQVFYLNQGGNIQISLTEETLIGSEEP